MSTFLVDLNTGEQLELQFLPRNTRFDSTANLQTISGTGQNLPDVQWTGRGRKVSFDVAFFATDELGEDALRKARWIEALQVSNEGVGGAPRVQIIFGDMFNDEEYVLENCSYTPDNIRAVYNLNPLDVAMQLSFIQVSTSQITRQKVLGSFPERTARLSEAALITPLGTGVSGFPNVNIPVASDITATPPLSSFARFVNGVADKIDAVAEDIQKFNTMLEDGFQLAKDKAQLGTQSYCNGLVRLKQGTNNIFQNFNILSATLFTPEREFISFKNTFDRVRSEMFLLNLTRQNELLERLFGRDNQQDMRQFLDDNDLELTDVFIFE